MGQSPNANCNRPQQDLFLKEIRIYQWRADSNFNLFIPRVYFKTVFAQLQQQRFNKFIEQQSSKHYFQISKFRQQLQQIPTNGDDKVIVFQSYNCTLKELQGKLSFQEALYVLQALLAGYEQIKKVYQTIIIDSNCCFVTIQGSVRAWINPNSKSNKLSNAHQGETIRYSVIQKIIKMVKESTQLSPKSEQFFSNLFFSISHSQANCSYGELRRWINEYCYTHSIIMSKKIELNNKKNGHRRSSRSNQNHCRRTEFSERQSCYKENNALFLSTQQSENRPFNRIRSMQKNVGLASGVFQVRDTNFIRQIEIKPNLRLQHSASQIFIRPKIQMSPLTISAMFQTAPQSYIMQGNILGSSSQSKTLNKDKNRLQIINNKNIQLQSQKPFQELNQKPIQILIQKKPSIIKQISRPQKTRQQKKSIQISIMNSIEENNNNQVRKQLRHRTQVDKERQRDTQPMNYSRPWITTKTITRLISDNQSNQSLKNSIAESSDYYNGSVYSGVLTQMGRDVGKPINLSRSKTIGNNQQI